MLEVNLLANKDWLGEGQARAEAAGRGKLLDVIEEGLAGTVNEAFTIARNLFGEDAPPYPGTARVRREDVTGCTIGPDGPFSQVAFLIVVYAPGSEEFLKNVARLVAQMHAGVFVGWTEQPRWNVMVIRREWYVLTFDGSEQVPGTPISTL